MKLSYLKAGLISLTVIAFITSSSTAFAIPKLSAQPEGPIVRMVLVNADSNTDIQVLQNGATINLDSLPTRHLNIRFEGPRGTKSVRFGLDGNSNYRVENVAPFALAGDNNGNYNHWTPSKGRRTVKGTAFGQPNCQGPPIVELELIFDVVEGPQGPQGPQGPHVSKLVLINADTDQDIGFLNNGATIDLTQLPTAHLNIRADTVPATVGSVKFQFNSTTKIENVAPYAYAGDNNGNYNAWTPPLGQHIMKATPYSASNGNGDPGISLTISLNVIASTPANAPPVAHAGTDQIIVLTENDYDENGEGHKDVSLNASGSFDPEGSALTYEWSGVPDPDDVVSPTISLGLGTHTFTLRVRDAGNNVSQPDSVVIQILSEPPPAPDPNAIFVDSTLSVAHCTNYSVENRNCSGSNGIEAYSKIATATQAAVAGTTIYIREGIHNLQNNSGLRFTTSGAPGAPIIVSGYPGDASKPIIQQNGSGYGAWPGFILDQPGFSHFWFKNFIFRNGLQGIVLGGPLGRVYDIRIEGVETYKTQGAGIQTDKYGAERVYIRNVILSDTHSTEGALRYRVNADEYYPGVGGRFLLARDTLLYNNMTNQAAGFISQEAIEHIGLIDVVSHTNEDLGIGSKTAGYNIYINTTAYNQRAASYYIRSAKKKYSNGNVMNAPPSHYLMLNGVGHGIPGCGGESSQGKLYVRPSTNLYVYNSTMASLTTSDCQWTGQAGMTISSSLGTDPIEPREYDYAEIHVKNSVLYAYDSNREALTWSSPDMSVVNDPDHDTNRIYVGKNNLYRGEVDYLPNHTDTGSIQGDPNFALNMNDTVSFQNLRPSISSPAINGGAAYGSEPTDYPQRIEEFLSVWNHFDDWSMLTQDEKTELVNYIRNAYKFDRDGNPRDFSGTPDIGAYEHA